jgi:hemolysin activation/secretion protein
MKGRARYARGSQSKSTGRYQAALSVSLDNALTLNDLLYLTLNQDLGADQAHGRSAQGTEGNTLGYSLPLGYWTWGASTSRSSYYQSVAGLAQNYVYRGSSGTAEVKLSRLLHRSAAGKTSLALKAFQRRSNNYIDDTEIEVQRRVVGGWELALEHKVSIADATLETNLSHKRGTGDFGTLPAPEEAYGEGTSRFGITSADVNLALPFKLAGQTLGYNVSWRGQYNHTALTPQDRFAIGGRNTVRGFDGESSLSAERGWVIRQDLSTALGASGQTLYLGLDYGEVAGPSSDYLVGKSLSGAVVGWRGSFKAGKILQYDVFVGRPVHKPEFFRTAPITAGFSLNLSLSLSF